jgi:hypothetical protein
MISINKVPPVIALEPYGVSVFDLLSFIKIERNGFEFVDILRV